MALYDCAESLRVIWDTKSGAEAIALEILSEALEAPLRQILTNAGKDANEIVCKVSGDKGYNVKTDEYGDMYKMGVIDPLKVTKNALKNAVSVATTIMSTNAIVTMARTYDAK